MFETRITKLFNIKYPIIAGGMHLLSRAELVAAVSNAGGLGILASTTFATKEELRQEIRKTQNLTDKPFGVNLNLFPMMRPRSVDEDINIFIDEGVEIIESSGASPEPYMLRLKEAGIKIIHKVPAVRFARKAETVGVDAVAIVGFECAGHPGMDDVTSLILVPLTVDTLKIPVVAGGGFYDARSFVAALALGADGVVMGTRFVATHECVAHRKVKEWLVKAQETETVLINRSIGLPMRVIKNKPAEKALEMDKRGASLEELLTIIRGELGRKAWIEGDTEAGVVSIGMVVGRIQEIVSVKDVIYGIVEEAKSICECLNHKKS
ncbi:MAG: nitronate monooxygenase [Candidatus Bathyarchaeota archaeon]|nr:nitronate monooxygenase [Candidatus Bathyarchaeota archaeon]MDH5733589.1 nitronate monooxygenase [Candidatus Bathyarchaeota archaeon]